MSADNQIKPGDVAIDLVKGGKVFVWGIAADTVQEHQDREEYDIQTYKGNATLDVRADEPVFSVTFLPSEPTTSFGNQGVYDMPRSRLSRIPLEEASDDRQRIQEELLQNALVTLLDTWETIDAPGENRLEATIAKAFGEERLQLVAELSRAEQLGEVGDGSS